MERFVAEREDLRCAYCHGALGDEQVVCDGCDTRLHADCRADLDRCPTLGCAGAVRAPRLAPARRKNRRAGLVALSIASLIGLALTLPAALASPRPPLRSVQGGWRHESVDMPTQLVAARALMAHPDSHGAITGHPRSFRRAAHGERPELGSGLEVQCVTGKYVVATWIDVLGQWRTPEIHGVVFLAPGEDASALREEMPDAQTIEIWSGIWTFRTPRRGR